MAEMTRPAPDPGDDRLVLFITVDTELWPVECARDPAGLRQAMDRCIYGRTGRGDFGLPHQLRVLNEHGLKAVFFVEALFADAVGIEPLRKIVAMVTDAGHEVQLHIHPEWLDETPAHRAAIAVRRGGYMAQYSEDEQAALIARGIENLGRCGVAVNAFRAGNYGADLATLRALARNGIAFDTSYNPCCFHPGTNLDSGELLLKPTAFEGVCEVPIAVFVEPLRGLRHLQLGSCSVGQLCETLDRATDEGWPAVVLVSHSFELMNRAHRRADPIMLRRFDRFCRFLADRHRTIRTTGFCGRLPAIAPPADNGLSPATSGLKNTAIRHAEQIARRLFH